jgi:alkylation response protein AidB-like acyl-CoA dehydrogenase
MDFRLNEQESMVQSAAREFAEGVVRPVAAALDKGAPFPWEVVREAGRLGYLGLPYPPELGGSGMGYLPLALTLEQVARASLGVAAIISVHHLATEALYLFAPDSLKKRLLPRLASGEGLGALAFTEAETGSNPKLITTKATAVQGGYRLDGEKTFVSMGREASVCILFAQGEGGVDAFAVELPVQGFHPGQPLDTMGGRGLPTVPVHLEDIFAPEGNRLGAPGKGYDVLLDVIATGKLCVAFQAVGVAQRALELALDYAERRQAYNAPLNRMQSIQWLLAEMATQVEAARWLAYRSMAKKDEGERSRREAAMAKLFCSRAAVQVTSDAMQVHGAYGYAGSPEIERLYRDAKLTEIYEGTSEIQRTIIARSLIAPNG